MFDPKEQKQTAPKTAVLAKNPSAKVTKMPDTVAPQDRIRERAYELYESRGRESGQDEQDWLRAEREILKQGR